MMNCWGMEFFPRTELKPYIVDSATSGVVYICFRSTEKRIIHRYTTDSNVTTCEWAYGKWDDRATLVYHPINDSAEV